jgi:hypothetical protein
MLANPTPFPAGWWAVRLPGVRDFDATYQFFPHDSLPPLRCPRFTGAFDWLPKPAEESHSGQSRSNEAYELHLTRLVRHLTAKGLTVPPDFVRWMTDPSDWRIPSCTDCGAYRSRDAAIVEDPPGSRVVPFYIDSQGCITWYLYLTPDGYSAVVAGGEYLCNDWHSDAGPNTPLDSTTPGEGPIDFTFVAPSVEAFFYRWRLENVLWFKLVDPGRDFYDPTPITAEERAYVDFYRRHPPPAT